MNGIRQRISTSAKQHLSNLSKQHDSAPPAPQTDRAFNLQSVQQLQASAAPIFVTIATVLEKLQPVIQTISAVGESIWTAIEPYHPEDLLLALYGMFLIFFGGVFMTLVASFEAAHIFGWDRIQVAVRALYTEWTKARLAFERDNKVDANRDGIADVCQLNATEVGARRLMVLSKSIDPENVATALEGLSMATIAVLATLRIRFAKAITLGTAIGQVLNQMLCPFSTPILRYALPDDYEKWIPVINKYGFRYIGMTACWLLMRVVTGVFASMRGSSLLIIGICGYLVRHDYVSSDILHEGNTLLVGVWGVLAVIGVYWQVSSSFQLSFPLNVVLLPLTIAERMVVFAVGASAN